MRSALFYLARNEHAGSRIEPRAGQTRYGVGAARPGCHKGDSQVVRVLAVCFRCNGAGLFVQIADILDPGVPAEGIDEVHTAPARQEEYMFYSRLGDALCYIVR